MANLGISEALDNLGNWITWEKAFGVQAASAAKQVVPATTCETMHISIVFFFVVYHRCNKGYHNAMSLTRNVNSIVADRLRRLPELSKNY